MRNKRRLTTALLVFVIAGLQYRWWLTDAGWLANYRLSSLVDAKAVEVTELAHRNEQLAAVITELKSGGPGVEAKARNQLGLVKNGETFYLFTQEQSTPLPAN